MAFSHCKKENIKESQTGVRQAVEIILEYWGCNNHFALKQNKKVHLVGRWSKNNSKCLWYDLTKGSYIRWACRKWSLYSIFILLNF